MKIPIFFIILMFPLVCYCQRGKDFVSSNDSCEQRFGIKLYSSISLGGQQLSHSDLILTKIMKSPDSIESKVTFDSQLDDSINIS